MNAFLVTLCALALAWAFSGLAAPRSLFFALPALQTRGNAFFFPLRLACIAALAGIAWDAADPGMELLSGLIAGIMLAGAVRRFAFLRGTPLQRMGVFLPSERHLFNQG
ncbi:MAG: hypothetical protein LBC79_08210 [Deltaproteobacteria bacterium]|jgi:hypothetical protein|nr:hypothetical protein [Deltaproteobacteria bacterium]